MSLRFASLGSGSEGNALLISAASGAQAASTVMLDCGFPVKETERRLARLALAPGDLDGIIVTHEHSDHVGGVFKLARRYDIPVWLSYGTWRAVERDTSGVALNICRDGEQFAIGGLQLIPYTVPHDAREPLQYLASDGQVRLGVLTDAGQSTPHLVRNLSGCDALMLECNHDQRMLAESSYPYSLKQRIGGAYGHLSNRTSGEILAAIDRARLKMVVGAHLSRQNNTPDLARSALSEALGSHPAEVRIACQDEGFDWIEVAA
jgi:phosphoribosyl 1,2-cyclic phosphodiesterase